MVQRKHAQRGGKRQSAPDRGESRPAGATTGTDRILEDDDDEDVPPPHRGEETRTAAPRDEDDDDPGMAGRMRPPDDS
jgi:hypothetical protein